MNRKIYKQVSSMNNMEKENKGIKLKCQNPECQNEWIYRGKNKFYACCSMCHSSVNVKKQNVKRE